MSQIIQHGLIPGGWPHSSGRAHSYFIATHPWDANMKKLARTRAGKPYYVAVDVEMAMQVGARLFRTDEAIMTPDWLPNECIICVYNAAEREFYWSNRAYAAGRKSYNERVKRSKDSGDDVIQALTQSKRGRGMDLLLEQWSNFLTGVEPGKFFSLVQPKPLQGVIAWAAASPLMWAGPLRHDERAKTRLVFMPLPGRDASRPLDVSKESMVCHSGRFYSLAQFAVYTAKLAPARGEPAPSVFGFSGSLHSLFLWFRGLLSNQGFGIGTHVMV